MMRFVKFWRILVSVLLAVVVLLVVLLVGVRLVGLRPFAVVSGSMESDYPRGCLIYVRSSGIEELEVGDAAVYVMNRDLDIAVHRVTEIDEATSYFHTKGDANAVGDAAPVHFKNFIGEPVFALPLLGYLAMLLGQPAGVVTSVVLVFVLILMAFVPEMVLRGRRRPMTKFERRHLR